MNNSSKFVIKNGIMKGEEKNVELGNANLGKWFLETLKSKPDFVGRVDAITGEELTYGKMAEESVRCALWLKEQGLKNEDIVLTCTSNQISTYIPILATLYNGASHIFASTGIQLQRARYLLNLLKPKFIFAEERELKILLEASKEEKLDLKFVVFNKVKVPGLNSLNEILSQTEINEIVHFSPLGPCSPHDNCLLDLTSGSTGEPKIAVHSYKAIMEALLIYNMGKTEHKIVSMYFLPVYWLNPLIIMLSDMLSFAKRIIVNVKISDLHQIFGLIQKYKVTDVLFTLSMIYRMLSWKELTNYDTSSLKSMIVGGAKLQHRILNFCIQMAKNCSVVQLYAATEISYAMFKGIMNTTDLDSCGYLLPNVSMKVVDIQTGAILGPKQKGELCFKSPGLMTCYFKNQSETDKAIDSEGWYHTGDFGYYDETGLGYVLGRIKNSLTVQNGKIVPLWEVQRALILSAEVTQTIILTISEIPDQPRIFAFVTLTPDSKITVHELNDIANNLSVVSMPVTVKIVEKMPLTLTSKPQLSELKKMAENYIQNNIKGI